MTLPPIPRRGTGPPRPMFLGGDWANYPPRRSSHLLQERQPLFCTLSPRLALPQPPTRYRTRWTPYSSHIACELMCHSAPLIGPRTTRASAWGGCVARDRKDAPEQPFPTLLRWGKWQVRVDHGVSGAVAGDGCGDWDEGVLPCPAHPATQWDLQRLAYPHGVSLSWSDDDSIRLPSVYRPDRTTQRK
jgi:hypothetical protein